MKINSTEIYSVSVVSTIWEFPTYKKTIPRKEMIAISSMSLTLDTIVAECYLTVNVTGNRIHIKFTLFA